MRFSLLLLPLAIAACAPAGAPPQGAASRVAPDARFGDVRADRAETLFVVLHGDAGAPAAPVAQSLVRDVPSSIAVALPRPGYGNAAGERGLGKGDSYTVDRITMLAEQIAALRQDYPRARVVLVGEDGGAALAADLAAIRPGIVDGLVLVACPCALPEWRAHMARRAPGQGWDSPVESLDPLKTAGGLSPETRVALIVAADDPALGPRFSRPYAEALALRGVAVDYRILPGRSGSVFQDPEVLAAAARLAAALPARSI